MKITDEKVQELIESLKGNSLVNKDHLNRLIVLWESGKISNSDMMDYLKKIRDLREVDIEKIDFKDDWTLLSNVIIEVENNIKNSTKNQLYFGLLGLPIFILSIFIFSKLDLFKIDISATYLTLLTIISGTVLAYTFFNLRSYQQTTIAMERLTEKRLAILYLKIVVNLGKDKIDSESLIKAGTAMFLGHHAPNTIPLSPEDLSAAKKV